MVEREWTMKTSIRRKLTATYITLAVSPLLLVGLILGWKSYTVQKEQALALQCEVSKEIMPKSSELNASTSVAARIVVQ